MSNNNNPPRLFDYPKNWEEEWQDMPEFMQVRQPPYSQIIIRFANAQDLEEFATAIGQKLTKKTKSIWYPFKSHWGSNQTRWVDES